MLGKLSHVTLKEVGNIIPSVQMRIQNPREMKCFAQGCTASGGQGLANSKSILVPLIPADS